MRYSDHAGIATQLLVERQLAKEGTSRTELGREAFLNKVWEWKTEKGGYITAQMKRLGASADWSREKFTLQPELSDAVTEAFIRLHKRGLIYRGSYMVNWSPHLQTAVSDLEVEYSEEQGTLYHFKYVLTDSTGAAEQYIPVATTRPETILGDAAVCVHPEDERYRQYIGRTVRVPFCDRDIPGTTLYGVVRPLCDVCSAIKLVTVIQLSGERVNSFVFTMIAWFCLYTAVIADPYVDREFGTGALKITPAHDPNDYLLAQRHKLPLINIMHKDASINAAGGKYAGLSREQCRTQLWSDIVNAGLALTEYTSSKGPGKSTFHVFRSFCSTCVGFVLLVHHMLGYCCYVVCYDALQCISLVTPFWPAPSRNGNASVPYATVGTKDHTQRVPRSQRGGEVIEPMVSAQWFVRTQGEL
jgi:valyl-tRNA synthetase